MGRVGESANRVLLIGDQQALVAPNDPEVRLAEHLADELVARTGRGLKLDTVWDLRPVLRAIGGATRARHMWQYDAIVVLIRRSSPTRSVINPVALRRLLHRVISGLGPQTVVELVFLAPATRTEPGRALRRFSQQVMTGLIDTDIQVSAITVPAGLLDAAGDAAAVADALAPQLPTVPSLTAGEQDASEQPPSSRAAASARPQVSRSLGLQRVLTLATRSFEVPFASVTLFDGAGIHVVARSTAAAHPPQIFLQSFRDDGARPVIVPDAHDDPLLQQLQTEPAGEPVRFWAAYPIQSLDGDVLGAVTVFDTVPHDMFTGDEIMLHDLAQLAGAEIGAFHPTTSCPLRVQGLLGPRLPALRGVVGRPYPCDP